jgi:hypothetical protein
MLLLQEESSQRTARKRKVMAIFAADLFVLDSRFVNGELATKSSV